MFSEGIVSEGKILTVVAVKHGTERGEQLGLSTGYSVRFQSVLPRLFE